MADVRKKGEKVNIGNISKELGSMWSNLKNKDKYIGKRATIRYFQLTPDGIPRFPYAVGFRDYE